MYVRCLRATSILVGALLLLSGSSPRGTVEWDPAHEAAADTLGEKISALENAIPRLMERGGIPGLSIALVEGGKVQWARAYGVMSMQTRNPVTTETTFEAASLSKPVFAHVVLSAVDRGVIDMDVPLSNVFDYDRFSPDERIDLITPRLVLSHKTGLPNWDRDGPLDLDRDPGIRFGYSGEGFVYLQKALERETGQPLNDLADEVVFEPFGLEDSSFLWRDDYERTLASGHNSGGEPTTRNRYEEENAAYSLVTTASDYGIFLGNVIKGARLSEASHEDLLSPQTSMQGDETRTKHPPEVWQAIHWGLSWGIQELDGERIYFHWGDNGAYHSFVAFSPPDDIGFVYFTNSQNGLKIAGDIAEIVVGDMTPAITWLGYGVLDPAEKN